GGRRGRGIEAERVRAQPRRRELEAGTGAGGRLEEQRAHRLAGEHAAHRGAAMGVAGQRVGTVEQALEQRPRQALEGEQVAQAALRIELKADAGDGFTGMASCGAASQRSTITAAATASSAAASRRRLRPSARSAAKR